MLRFWEVSLLPERFIIHTFASRRRRTSGRQNVSIPQAGRTDTPTKSRTMKRALVTSPRLAVLGLGKMGSSMALRLRESGHDIAVWNRSVSKAHAVAAEHMGMAGQCSVSGTARGCVSSLAHEGSAVLLVLSDTATTLDVIDQVRDELHGRTVVNLTSGNPDDGRLIAAVLAAPELGVRAYVDGAYCGPPTKARQGAGAPVLLLEPVVSAGRLPQRHLPLAQSAPASSSLPATPSSARMRVEFSPVHLSGVLLAR